MATSSAAIPAARSAHAESFFDPCDDLLGNCLVCEGLPTCRE